MSNYTKATNFAVKDGLPSGNPAKLIKGTEIDTEFTAIQTAVATKADEISPSLSGTVTLAAGTNISTNGATVSDVELSYLDTVSSNIQTQLNAKQASDATLTSIAALGTAADKIAYTTGVDTWAETPLTAAARTVLDDATVGAMLVTLGAAALAGSSSQDFAVKILTAAGLLDISGASAGQIKFPAIQNASADANTLDDYEEGSWTPTIVGSSTAGVGTYTTQSGRYTKIGNKVTLHGSIVWTAHTGAGNIWIGGLPFTSAANNIAYGNGEWVNLASISGAPLFYIGNSFTIAAALGVSTTTGANTPVPIDTAASVFFSITYMV